MIGNSRWRQSYRVQCQVSPHVVGCDPIEHSSTSQRSETLGNDVEESTEQGHLRANQVGKGNGWVDVSSTDVANRLDEGGGRQTKAKGNMKNIMGSGGPAEGRPQPEEHEEHCAIELSKHRPPERHGPELPHGGERSKSNFWVEGWKVNN